MIIMFSLREESRLLDPSRKMIYVMGVIVPLIGIFCCVDCAMAESILPDEDQAMFSQNNILFYEPCSTEGGSTLGGDITIAGKTAEEKIWSGLASFLTDEQAAGILGNIGAEENPSYGPTIREVGQSGNLFDRSAQLGLGLIQWSFGRRVNLLNYIKKHDSSLLKYFEDDKNARMSGDEFIKKHGDDVANKIYQLEIQFLKNELDKGYKGYYKLKDAGEAAVWFRAKVERAGVYSDEKRSDKAKEVLKKYGGKTIEGGTGGASSIGSKGSGTCKNFVYYAQMDSKWKDKPFGARGTVGGDGCGPTSFAMMATQLLGKDILPDMVASAAGNYCVNDGSGTCGSSHKITEFLAKKYDLDYKNISASSRKEAMDNITKYLKEGWMIHTSGAGGAVFRGGHYIGIRAITDDGKWLLADSASSENSKKEWTPDRIMDGMSISNIHAIRSKNGAVCGGGGGNECGGEDGVGGGGLVAGGMNLAQAKEFVKAYHDAAMGKYKNRHANVKFQGALVSEAGCSHGVLNNCVAFSQWFINKYTSAGPKWGHTANGVNMVDNVSQISGVKKGNSPRPYAIFSKSGPSSAGHTGVILGVDKDKKKVIVGEASCSLSYEPQAAEYSFSEVSSWRFAYLDDILKGGL